MDWREASRSIKPVSDDWLDLAKKRLDDLTKPRGSLGYLEEIAAQYVAVREEERPTIDGRDVFVFVGDHDVVSEGVSAYPQEVTALMVRNFLGGGAAINVLARCAGARVSVIDIGMKEDLDDAPGLIKRNVKRGAANIAKGPAMTEEEADRAINVGVEMAARARNNGSGLIATGEMGIGNTTPSSAIFASLLQVSAEAVTGRGTGLSKEGLSHKIEVIEKALIVNRKDPDDPFGVLAGLGGLEIAAICGLCLGGAAQKVPVVVDGFISTAGALVAMRLNPAVRSYLFFSHRSAEKGHRRFFQEEGIRPILDLELRLGEGTGSAIAMQIIDDALKIYHDMATFSDIGIEPGA